MGPDDPAVLRKALRLLAIQGRSEAEMRRRLSAVGDPAAVEKVVDKLRSLKYLDDAELARALAEKHLVRALHGPCRTRLEMERAGLPPDLVQSAIDATLEEHPARELLARAVHKEARGFPEGVPDPRDRRRLFDRLARRGFDPETIREAIEHFRRGEE